MLMLQGADGKENIARDSDVDHCVRWERCRAVRLQFAWRDIRKWVSMCSVPWYAELLMSAGVGQLRGSICSEL